MADATLFSNPEYVWTTNHCFADVLVSLIRPLPPSFLIPAFALTPALALTPSEHPVHHPRERHVHRGEEDREDDHHRENDRGGVDDIRSAGPRHPPELARYFAEELLDALEELHVLSSVPDCARTARIWQAWRDSNPHPPDLESGALAVRATRLRNFRAPHPRRAPRLLRLLMRIVLPAPLAELLDLHAVRMRPLVLGRRVVPPLAFRTGERDDVAHRLLRDLRDDAGAHRAPPLADREPQLLLHRHRLDQLDRHRHVVPRHHHLHPARQRAHPRHVRRPEVELRPVPVEERRVPPPLVLPQHVHLRLELLVRLDRPRLRQHLPPLHLVLVNAPEQGADVIARPPF